MTLVPTRHFFPATAIFLDSFQTSFSEFHRTHFRFFRYNSSSPLERLNSYSTRHSNSFPDQNPTRKSRYLVGTRKPVSQPDTGLELDNSSNWLDKWNEPRHQTRPKPSKTALDYGDNEDLDLSSDDGGGGSAMEKIVERLKKFGYVDDGNERRGEERERVIEKGSIQDIFYVEEGMLPNSRGGFSRESPLGEDSVFVSGGKATFPWEKPEKLEEEGEGGLSARRKSKASLAELTLPESELRRLRKLTFQIKNRMKIGGGGVTQAVVDAIHQRWKDSEIVRVKVEGAPALNMKRMHEILEKRTGGLVIWRSGTSVSLYRGVSYEVPSVQLNKQAHKRNETPADSIPTVNYETIGDPSRCGSHNYMRTAEAEEMKDTETPEVKYEDEVDQLLDSLGPRYADWSGVDPLPVDADMLPGIISGYQPPFRILPYGVRSTLGRKEATSLRNLARVIPPHFALGRSRQLQGLAVAMIKLWEKSLIAKIALKRGVQLTTSERMAEDIKKLTGGILLSRNKYFLVFYRGKDFLSPDVTEALVERERLAKSLQDEEEQARLRASALVTPRVAITEKTGTAGTLEETLDADARWARKLDDQHKEEVMKEAEIIRHSTLVRKLERELSFAERKLQRAERALAKVEGFLKPAARQADPASITEEERFMFRKLGLRMKAFLLLGRRGVFDGTVENMHLHWKYRELVKIIVKAKTFNVVKRIALALEAESGGVLVSVDKISKGFAIIVFRGKDYQRPSILRPKNLLTKRKALARSIEIQRREDLLKHITAMEAKVERIKSEIGQMDAVKEHGDEELYDELESAYLSEDEEIEEEGDDTYLESYINEKDDDDDETNRSIHSLHLETKIPYRVQNRNCENVPEVHAVAVPNKPCIMANEEEEEEGEHSGIY